MKCLVVDDSAITRRILIRSLREIGITDVLEASDGLQALALASPDLDIVITDWNMPGLTGVELLRRLRAKPELATIPVLLVTARNGRDNIVEAANAGVTDYLVKPFTPEVLRVKLAEILGDAGDPGATGTDG
jgi:two-component system chemotaxis response regulator CheY